MVALASPPVKDRVEDRAKTALMISWMILNGLAASTTTTAIMISPDPRRCHCALAICVLEGSHWSSSGGAVVAGLAGGPAVLAPGRTTKTLSSRMAKVPTMMAVGGRTA